MFKKITIIGLGLIGGSLGLAIKEKHLSDKVIGVSRRRSTLIKALSLKAVDSVTLDLKKAVSESDFIILCTPVDKVMKLTSLIAKFLKKGTIVTDAGSTKSDIVKHCEKAMPEGVNFVGSHPLAGSEKSGLWHAEKDLFKDASCIVTRAKRTDSKALSKVNKFWKALGMKVENMSPDMHDKIVSKVSHLPHALSVALSNSCSKKDLKFASGGFKDVSRIASGSPELWKDIFKTNKKNLARDINLFKKQLLKLEKALKSKKDKELLKILDKAKTIRDSI